MKPEHYERVQEIFLAVCDCEPQERERLLDEACGDDQTLRAQVERLLASDDEASGILNTAGVKDDWCAPAMRSPTDEARDHADGTPSYPQRIGRYAIRGILGEGGMGIVYRAEQDHPRREVALKIIRPAFSSKHLLRRLEHEAELLGRLQHPGIAQIFDAGTADAGYGPQPFFAMELAAGQTITDYARAKSLGTRARLELFLKICEAIEHAHQRGIIHRDLKPGNILVDPAGQPKVLDFGVARTTDSDIQTTTLHTDIGQLIGTVPYMSPEQVGGDPTHLDTRSDVYALGVVCYELLTGRLPYDLACKTIPEAARIIEQDDITPLSTIDRVFRGDLETIVTKALEKDKEQRYQSASSFGADIRRYLRNEPISARPPSALYQLRKLATRHRAAAALAGLLLAAIVTFGLVAAWQAARLARQRDTALAAQRSESEARQSAEQITEFLVSLFEQGNPNLPRAQPPSVSDVLAAGVSRVETELAGQRRVQARLLNVLGEAYLRLSEHQRASELLESAIALRRRELGNEHPDVAESLCLLAQVHTAHGKHGQADALLNEAYEIQRRNFGDTDAAVAEVLEGWGCARFYARDDATAAVYFRRALEIRERLYGREHLEVASSLSNLGRTLGRIGETEEAEEMLRECLATRRKLLGDHWEVTLTLDNLAHVVVARGGNEEAEQILEEAVNLARRILHQNHPRIAYLLTNYATLVWWNQDLEQAVSLYREALAIRRTAYDDDHPEVAAGLRQLGVALTELGDVDEAITHLSAALDIHRAHSGNRHDDYAESLQALGVAYLRAGKYPKAESLLLESMDISTANHGEQCLTTKATINFLVALYERWDRPDLAAEWHAKVEALRAEEAGEVSSAESSAGPKGAKPERD